MSVGTRFFRPNCPCDGRCSHLVFSSDRVPGCSRHVPFKHTSIVRASHFTCRGRVQVCSFRQGTQSRALDGVLRGEVGETGRERDRKGWACFGITRSMKRGQSYKQILRSATQNLLPAPFLAKKMSPNPTTSAGERLKHRVYVDPPPDP